MSLWEELAKLNVGSASVIGMVAFVEAVRQEIEKKEALGFRLTAMQKTEKEFVDAWDDMIRAWNAESELNGIREPATELGRRQKEFDERFARLLFPKQ